MTGMPPAPLARQKRVAVAGVLLMALAGCSESGTTSDAPGDQAGVPSASAETPVRSAPPAPRLTTTRPPAPTGPSGPSLPALPETDTQDAGGRPIPSTDEPVLGGDVSWPQCPVGMGIPQKRSLGSPMPLPEARYVIIGLTNGPGMYPNPCLPAQVEWARTNDRWVAAYAVASYPEADALATYAQSGPFDGSTPLGALKNTGYQQARFNVTSMIRTGFETPIVWIDVEPVPDFEWSSDPTANAAVVEGIARGYRDAGYRIGVYSTPVLWAGVVGDFSLGGVPEWRAAGQTSSAEALSRCSAEWSIQGGQGIIGQWVEDARDQNLTCPGVSDLQQWFYRY